jgi:hypothetical protein
MNKIEQWCQNNGLILQKNKEAFFINERAILTPDYNINNKFFIEIIDDLSYLNENQIEYRKYFSKSYSPLLCLTTMSLDTIDQITKKDIENYYHISL